MTTELIAGIYLSHDAHKDLQDKLQSQAERIAELVDALTEAVKLIDNLNSAYGSNSVDSVARRGEEAIANAKGAK